jgi:type VI secretion system protein ImpH
MANQARTATRALDLARELEREPYRFGFFQTLRRLEAENKDHPRLGESTRAAEDPIRLGQKPSMIFAPSTLTSYERGHEGKPDRLDVLFFGLFGPNGPMPNHLTEYVHDRVRNAKDTTFKHFADLFHHRMLSLFYRAWANAQPTVGYDRPDSDRFAEYVGALIGIGMPSLRDRGTVRDETRLHFAGHLSSQTRNAEGLQSMLRGYFGVEVTVDEFIGQWVALPESARCRLGQSPLTGTLGQTAIAGERIWDRGQRFRITMGPMGMDIFHELLPGGKRLRELMELVRSYVHDEFVWDVRLILNGDDVPPLQLGESGRLGWTSWLPTEFLRDDVDDFLLDPMLEGGSDR